MTYLGFHLVFILPPLALLAAMRPWARMPRGSVRFLPLLAGIALVYTTPWDNYLVARGVWGYGADRVMGTIGYVPVEEYLFFILQPLLTGLWLYTLVARDAFAADRVEGTAATAGAPASASRRGRDRTVRVWGTLAYLGIALAGGIALTREQGTYLGLILVWAAPVLAGQWAYAGHRIARHARAAILGVAVPTVYLWVADAAAIRLGIWSIAERYILGVSLWGLPIEEAVFFLATNVLVVQGLLVFLDPPSLRLPERTRTAGESAGVEPGRGPREAHGPG